ncbi:hypothetical protein [Silvimonas sp.]|uniref:hypothetical protein n=1 Tax=Silvimonas sp. TaxID=2650811 RepID=UPI00284471D7|nr:hypothetical protein [Silvimonas sp.]MDR3426905.1 hypothetical protein [Silvimonas sp.]
MRAATLAARVPDAYKEDEDDDDDLGRLVNLLGVLGVHFDPLRDSRPVRMASDLRAADDRRGVRRLTELAVQMVTQCLLALCPNDPMGMWALVSKRMVPSPQPDPAELLATVTETASAMLAGMSSDSDGTASRAVEAVFAYVPATLRQDVLALQFEKRQAAFHEREAAYQASVEEYHAAVEVGKEELVPVEPRAPVFDSEKAQRRSKKAALRLMSGLPLTNAPISRQATSPDAVAQLVSFAHRHVARLSWDSMRVYVDGEYHVVKAKQRLDTISGMYQDYAEDKAIPEELKVGRTVFFGVVTAITGKAQQVWQIVLYCVIAFMSRVCLLAQAWGTVDAVALECGAKNFQEMRTLAQFTLPEAHRARLLESIDAAEKHMKIGYRAQCFEVRAHTPFLL